ncbi:MAG: type IV pili methyl-accepting chemotaxis transducer N-terminal domain-containing protein [Limnohabitans sp.]
MKIYQRLSTKFFSIGLGLLILALLSIGLTMWITRQLDGGAAAVNEAGRLRMQAWRLVSAKSIDRVPADVSRLVGEFDGTMRLLGEGDPSRPLFVPWEDATRARFADLDEAWRDLRPAWQPGARSDITDLILRVDTFVSRVDGLVRAIEGTMARLTAVLNLFQLMMMALAVVAAILMLYVGYLFVIQPLQRMRVGLQQVEAGDFSARVTAESADEFGELAAGFNHMAATLQGLYEGLERKVAEKTRDLESKRHRLAALYEVSNFLVSAHTLEELAQGFARKIRHISGADAVAVRWSDEASQRYLMLASDCLPEDLAREERCLESGLCACGQPQASARTRVIPIISEHDHRLGNCVRAGYESLVSVPVRLQQRILGEVDLFYRHDATLSTEDRDLYDALTGHLANAIENLRTEALVREAAVSEERTLLARELHDSIAQSLSFLKIQVSLLRSAIDKRDEVQLRRVLDEIDAGVRESTNDVRELLVHFRTRTDSHDIEQALRTTLRKFEHQSGLKARLDMHGHGVALPSDVQLQVLHVVQEALSNVRKHAKASQVQVDVHRGPRWVFCVRDNGVGFNPDEHAQDETHVGLQIMRERADRIGARIEVSSLPAEGTEVRITLNT